MDKGFKDPLYGNYRAKVVNNKDKEKFGRVIVWIPDLMPDIPDDQGIWARPANNPMGGRNAESDGPDNHFAGTSYIPLNGSWVWVFFEAGNINRPYYFGALDIENTPVLAENQVGENYQLKYTLFKSHSGRAIVVSDDPDDARVEITGKKREMKEPPSGDLESVYKIDDNMTTIFFDERNGTQKILIRTYLGDFVHIDIDERKLQAEFESDIIIKTNGKFQLTATDDIDIKTIAGDMYVEAGAGHLDVKTADVIRQYSGGDMSLYSGAIFSYRGEASVQGTAGVDMNHDAGGNLNEQSGAASTPSKALGAQEAEPKGERDT
jgi:hypothetical protein